MKLSSLTAKHYRSLYDATMGFDDLSLFIGANAAGKSTILDALRFLHEGARKRDFRGPVSTRGGFPNLAWKGELAQRIELSVRLGNGGGRYDSYEWSVGLVKEGREFHVEERVAGVSSSSPPAALLEANKGEGWWWSGEGGRVALKQAPTACALAAAAADASFPARDVAEFVSRWGFFDPNPFLLRRDWSGLDSDSFDPYGRNLGETLHTLHRSSPEVLEKIVAATQTIVGLPEKIEPRESEDRFYFVQHEPGLRFQVHQMGVSSGTLRMLALMTALFAEPETKLIGIEEPENYLHPTALSDFVEYLRAARGQAQCLLTTHSPLLLDFLNEPAAVRIVQHRSDKGTTVLRQENPDGVQRALEESGFGLGQFYETKGFGAAN